MPKFATNGRFSQFWASPLLMNVHDEGRNLTQPPVEIFLLLPRIFLLQFHLFLAVLFASCPPIGKRQVVVGLRVVWFDFDGALKIGNALLPQAIVFEVPTHLVLRIGEPRVRDQGRLKQFPRLNSIDARRAS
jgi:hypothetical protein